MRESFVDIRSAQKFLHKSTYKLIEQSNAIITEYEADGYLLTLRQLYYRLVSRNLLKNSKQSYKTLGHALSTGRINGLVDWDILEDRVRNLRSWGDSGSPEQFFNSLEYSYAENLWINQPNYIEIRAEKDAITNVIQRGCSKWRVPFLACRGFSSQSEMYEAAKRLQQKRDEGKEVYIIHVGDHDPSGQDMTRDTEERFRMFLRDDTFQIHRLALNMDQIRYYKPLAAPGNVKDSRYKDYVRRFGKNVWEVDALEPKVLVKLVSDAIEALCDVEQFEKDKAAEAINLARVEYYTSNFERGEKLLKADANTDTGDYVF